MPTPSAPVEKRCEQLLAVLADIVARGGAAPLMLEPVKPGGAAFPEPWKATRGGVEALLRRLAWHAGGLGERTVTIQDDRLGAPPTEHRPRSRCELVEVRRKELVFSLGFIGEDDIVGTLAHEIGVAYAVLHRPDEADPYRTSEQPVMTVDPDRDLERGSIATVYLGLGVMAANAAFQQYNARVGVNAYQSHALQLHRAGYVELSDLAFLLAVQAVVRGERAAPAGLGGPQRDEVTAWIDELAPREADLCERLGAGAAQRGSERPTPVRFTDVDLSEEVATARRTGFRWATHRGGLGMILGLVVGIGLASAVANTQMMFWGVSLGSVAAGGVGGRRIRAIRCSSCATVIGAGATSCRKCGAVMRGDIARLSDRLEAEERLEAGSDRDRA